MRNAECGVQRAECRMQNAECGMRNAELYINLVFRHEPINLLCYNNIERVQIGGTSIALLYRKA